MKVIVYVAVSATGHLATFAGMSFTRKTLGDVYRRLYGRTLKEDGYQVVKAVLSIEKP